MQAIVTTTSTVVGLSSTVVVTFV